MIEWLRYVTGWPRAAPARAIGLAGLWLCAALLAGCGQNMRDDSRIQPYEAATFYPDAQSARPVISGTLALGLLQPDELLETGKIGGQLADQFPFTVTREVLQRGRQRYSIYCAPCHGLVGDGNGTIVQRGFSPPPTYHQQRLRDAPSGYLFDVIANGFGRMYSYGDRVEPRDRWAIVAYIRALQLSQNATLDDVPPEQRQQLQSQGGAERLIAASRARHGSR